MTAATTTRAASLGRDAAWGVVAVALEKAVALGIALYLPRHLALADYGHYVLVVSYLGFFQALPDAALETALVARLASADGRRLHEVAGRAAALRLAVSFGGAAVGLAVLTLVTRDASLVGAGAVAAAGFAVLAGSPYRALLRAAGRLGAYVAVVGVQSAVALALLALVVRAGGGLVPVLAAVSAAAIAGPLAGRVLAGRGARLAPDRGLAAALATAAWPIAATSLAVIGPPQVLQLLLLRLHGAAAVGLLGGASRLIEAVGLLPQAVMLGLLPALARVAADGPAATAAARDAARALLVVVVPAAVALAVWPEPLLRLLLGPRLADAAPVLRALAPLALLNATGLVLGQLLVVLGLQRLLLRTSVAGSIVLLAAGIALVPGRGAVGAALAVVAGMTAGQLLLALAPRGAGARPVLVAALRPVALGAVVAAVAARGGTAAALGALLIGWPAALVISRTITAADVARWRGAAGASSPPR